ncbi:hypothetical protein GOODEAATRI_014052, partial [Goodea atripinnis]
MADIYWVLLHPETTACRGVLSSFLRWKSWISTLAPYIPPPDPPHVTLFYDRNNCECYQESFADELE